MNLNDIISARLDILNLIYGGGPGSGRRPLNNDAHQKLVQKGYKFSHNTNKGQTSVYKHKRGELLIDKKGNWQQNTKHGNVDSYGNFDHLDEHLSYIK